MIGRIVKAISSFYYIEFEGKVYECRAKGVLKKNKISPLTGDFVEFEIEKGNTGNLITVVNRKNCLIRPPVANIDEAVLVVAVKNPEPSLLFIDKQLLFLIKNNIPVTICLNKIDSGEANKIKEIYEKIGYKVIQTSVKDKIGIKELRENIKGKTITFIGNSGVGKSSITNQLVNNMIMEEGNLSKIERGKQTTRHSELLKTEDETYIIDTPGFSSFDLEGIELNELAELFAEFRVFFKDCKYKDCRHILEEACGVRKAVNEGKISDERYKNFKILYDEIKNIKMWK